MKFIINISTQYFPLFFSKRLTKTCYYDTFNKSIPSRLGQNTPGTTMRGNMVKSKNEKKVSQIF